MKNLFAKKGSPVAFFLISMLGLGVASFALAQTAGTASDYLNTPLLNTQTPAEQAASQQRVNATNNAANQPTSITCDSGQALYDPSGKPIGCEVPPQQINRDPSGAVVSAVCPTGSQAYYSQPSGALYAITGGLAGNQGGTFVACITGASSVSRGSNPNPASATVTGSSQSYKIQYNIPCQPTAGGTCPTESNSSPAAYIVRLYQFGLMIVGLLAFGAIVYGALKYILSAGSMADQSDAKDQITQALWGVVLLLSAYTLLYTINPQLVSLNDPSLAPLNLIPLQSSSGGTSGSQIPTASIGAGGDPLCKLSVNTGISATFSTSAGSLSGTAKGCVQCQPNATKDSSGTCQCNSGYVSAGYGPFNQCVTQQNYANSPEGQCNAKTNYSWVNGQCVAGSGF